MRNTLGHTRLLASRLMPALAMTLALATPAKAQERGLQAGPEDLASPRWQARFERAPSPLLAQAGTPLWLLGQRPQAMRLLGDYQFDALRLGQTGGLRLTGGLLLNMRQAGSQGQASDAGSALLLSGSGYAGVGYATSGLRGAWGFSADLGLSGLAFGQSQAGAIDQAWGVREQPGLQPQLRLGMRLSF